FGDTGQPDERGSADELGHVLCVSHAPDHPRSGTARVTAPAARRTPPAAREFPYAVERWTSRPTPDREVTRAPNHDARHHADRARAPRRPPALRRPPDPPRARRARPPGPRRAGGAPRRARRPRDRGPPAGRRPRRRRTARGDRTRR